ncbi:MAG: class I tRNA ligase family protein [Verrucomicrobia bacterium]|nr:class I tRNA ligase family protein [Verrucomicrobiota bacterium]
MWVASLDYRNDVAISREIIKITADAYRSIRNTLRFQLGNLHDFDYAKDAIAIEQLTPLDRWALHELAQLVPSVTEAYEQYEFHKVYQLVNRFYAVTLSARYHDFCKDRLYTMRADSEDRRSAQTVIYHMFHTLNRLLAPILVFTSDEAHRYSQGDGDFTGDPVHLQTWPVIPANWSNEEVAGDVERLLDLRDQVNEKLEQLRGAKVIGKSIDGRVVIAADRDNPLLAICQRYREFLPELFIVSQVVLQESAGADLQVVATKAEGVRCPRCWRWVESLVQTPAGEVCERCADALALFNN